MTNNAEILSDALKLLEKVRTNRTDERSDRARFYNASQGRLEDFVAYFRTFVLTIEEIESASPPEALGVIAPGLKAGVKRD